MANIFPSIKHNVWHTPRGGFSPDQISNLDFWFDGNDSSTFTLNGTKVITWADKSGNSRDLTNATDAERPTYNAATGRVTFTAANHTWLETALIAGISPPNTMIMVFEIGTTRAYFCSGASGYQSFRGVAGYFDMYCNASLGNAAFQGGLHIHYGTVNGINSFYYIDNSLIANGDAGTQARDGVLLGARTPIANWSDVDIVEYIAYNKELTASERGKVDTYLKNKWGIS